MMERYLQQALKNWAARQQPPENVRSRLILMASSHEVLLQEPANYHFDEKAFFQQCSYSTPSLGATKSFDFVWAFHLPIAALRMV